MGIVQLLSSLFCLINLSFHLWAYRMLFNHCIFIMSFIISYHIIVGQDPQFSFSWMSWYFHVNVKIDFQVSKHIQIHICIHSLNSPTLLSPSSLPPVSYFYINCCILIPYLLSRINPNLWDLFSWIYRLIWEEQTSLWHCVS